MKELKLKRVPDNVLNAEYWSDPQACGSENWYKASLFVPLFLTDGAKVCCEKNACHWINDIVASYFPKLRRFHDPSFFVVRVFVEGSECDFYIEDGNGNQVVHQHIPFTDLGVNIKYYLAESVVNDRDCYVLMLPSEN